MAIKWLIKETEEAVRPPAARYLQLPTQLSGILQEYFSYPADKRWLPSTDYLMWRGRDQETALLEQDRIVNSIEIGRLEDYVGDKQTGQPKILVRRGGVAKRYPGISGQRRQGMAARDELRNVVASQYGGTLICFCMSSQPGQADHLGGEVEQLFSHFGEEFRCELWLQTFRVSQVGDVGILKEFPKFFVVPVVIDYAYEDGVQVTNRRTPVRAIQVNIQ
jgi:hypothetical protein